MLGNEAVLNHAAAEVFVVKISPFAPSHLTFMLSLPTQRFGLVSRFNEDSSIDALLMTTSVGGLGLNLTGADTVRK